MKTHCVTYHPTGERTLPYWIYWPSAPSPTAQYFNLFLSMTVIDVFFCVHFRYFLNRHRIVHSHLTWRSSGEFVRYCLIMFLMVNRAAVVGLLRFLMVCMYLHKNVSFGIALCSLVTESGTWGKVRQKWNEYDQSGPTRDRILLLCLLLVRNNIRRIFHCYTSLQNMWIRLVAITSREVY